MVIHVTEKNKNKNKKRDFGKKLFKNLLVSQSYYFYFYLLSKKFMEPNYVQGLCASIGLLKCSEGENLNPKKKKKENNESCFVSLFSKFNFDVGLLAMHGKTGIIWCSLHPQSLTLAQYAEFLKHVEIGFKSELSVRGCNLKIL